MPNDGLRREGRTRRDRPARRSCLGFGAPGRHNRQSDGADASLRICLAHHKAQSFHRDPAGPRRLWQRRRGSTETSPGRLARRRHCRDPDRRTNQEHSAGRDRQAQRDRWTSPARRCRRNARPSRARPHHIHRLPDADALPSGPVRHRLGRSRRSPTHPTQQGRRLAPSSYHHWSSATALNRAEEFPGWIAGRALGIERSLQQQGRCRLVDHRPPLPRIPAALPERGMGQDGGKSLIEEPDRNGRDRGGKLGRESPCVSGCPARPTRQAGRQADHDLDRAMLGGQAGDLSQISAATPDGGKRAGQHATWIASRHADSCRSDIDCEPDTWPQRTGLRAQGLRIETIRLQHDLTLRYPRYRCRQ